MIYGSKNIFRLGVAAMLAVTIVLISLWKASRPIDDPDLWWHLKTGAQIVSTGSVPLQDDFAFTSERFDTARERAILRGYPITQVALYFLYSTMGDSGILASRLLLCAALIAVILARSRRMGVSLPVSLAALCAGLAAFFSSYSMERPQNASFLFFALLMGVLEQADREERPTLWLFPLMLLWANSHGGFIVGDICLVLFALGHLIKSGFNRSAGVICAWAAGGVLASLINPNGYAFFLEMVSISEKRSFGFIQEYQSAWSGILRGDRSDVITVVMALIWAGWAIGMLVKSGRRSLPLFLASAFVVAISLKYTRNAPFILLGMAPTVAAAMDTLTKRMRPGGHDYRQGAGVVCGVLVLAIVWSHPAGIARPPLTIPFTIPHTVATYPARATAFIADNALQGRMFNEYNWGGYLIWNLYPRQRVFIDGRVLDEPLLDDYIRIAKGSLNRTPEGKFELVYAHLLDEYHVDVIVQAIVQMQYGGTQPLMGRLLDDPAWVPVYLDEHAYIFVRNGTNERIIRAKRIEKADFLRRMENIMRSGATDGSSMNILGMADLLMYQNRLAEAGALLTDADRRQPGNPQVRKRLEFLARQGVQR